MPNLVYSKSSKRISWETNTGVATLSHVGIASNKHDLKQIEFQTILGVLKIEQSSGPSSEYLVCVTEGSFKGIYRNAEIYKIERIRFINTCNPEKTEEITSQIKGFIQSHDFYYFLGSSFLEDEFEWNKHMKVNLLRYSEQDSCAYKLSHSPHLGKDTDFEISTLFCGFFIESIFKASAELYNMTLLSLVSSSKVGTRYLCRGIDADGNVSMFVKTRFVIRCNKQTMFDFTIVRGSVPLFWSQKEYGFPTKVSICADEPGAHKAFIKHFEKLTREYGKIHVVNLLGEKKDEKLLTSSFSKLLDTEEIPYTEFDLNAYANDYDNMKFLLYFKLQDVCMHDVVFRVNCLDCLDRTNVAQSLICMFYLEKIVHDREVLKRMQECWSENGNALSNLYTGSDAMKGDLALQGKRSLMGYMDDIIISATRLINGRFIDKQKHGIINTLLEKSGDNTYNEDNE
ncbi:phosphoinositide polyphosphatase [Ordospora colligata]|uniref:Phosphoinositide polyphosphatase n=1 Tax=Ordospora colligata OC4 TaxID=1354746 RepID=A0A0B2UJJ1_9MICR|nr:phosphoinositide polyphosphatase [Ordospora colligata OC4]KHN69212.1 phosphoinositide polyphosphatase [Ordospora colligata OC4]TBU14490.1 phosphoinositide polyphosphatase [Ordospora colligata]TBU14667.1 phosphoinositide polyphosphatase [Ordospora colligata]TBU18052.1 phosphoinositide polyphosphatase [Ordospora colligata]